MQTHVIIQASRDGRANGRKTEYGGFKLKYEQIYLNIKQRELADKASL